jgi:hypothetical protein
MPSGSTVEPYIDAAEVPLPEPLMFPAARPSTGTADDDDEPEDEHEGENETPGGEQSDNTKLPEEFKRDDEDRTDSDE